MPQSPRSLPEMSYFDRSLQTISAIIRNCGFMYFYPAFESPLWILYEIAEYVLTCTGRHPKTSDIAPFFQHIFAMFENGVQATLAKYGYRCSYERDQQLLTSWLELLVLLRQTISSIDTGRTIMDNTTWFCRAQHQLYAGVELKKFEGILVVNGRMYTFTPFPQWVRVKSSRTCAY